MENKWIMDNGELDCRCAGSTEDAEETEDTEGRRMDNGEWIRVMED